MLNIIVDEIKTEKDIKLPKIPKGNEWTICRSYKELLTLLEYSEVPPARISISDIVNKGETALETKTAFIVYGVTCEICLDKEWDIPKVYLHDSNQYEARIKEWTTIAERYC